MMENPDTSANSDSDQFSTTGSGTTGSLDYGQSDSTSTASSTVSLGIQKCPISVHADTVSPVDDSGDPTDAGKEDAMGREQRFAQALNCRAQGKGVKPRQGCASERLNRDCRMVRILDSHGR
jgi:hypothetical protein